MYTDRETRHQVNFVSGNEARAIALADLHSNGTEPGRLRRAVLRALISTGRIPMFVYIRVELRVTANVQDVEYVACQAD